jgi:hypothetical protein
MTWGTGAIDGPGPSKSIGMALGTWFSLPTANTDGVEPLGKL